MKAETLANYEAFALAYVRDPSQSLAALVRKIVNPRMKVKTASDLAAHWMKPEHAVAKRIAELQSDIRMRAEAQNKEAEANGTLPVFLSVEEKRKRIADYVRFEPGNFDPDNAEHAQILCGIRKTQFGTNYIFPDKLAAIKLDNDLAGVGAEAVGTVTTTSLIGKLIAGMIRPGLPLERGSKDTRKKVMRDAGMDTKDW